MPRKPSRAICRHFQPDARAMLPDAAGRERQRGSGTPSSSAGRRASTARPRRPRSGRSRRWSRRTAGRSRSPARRRRGARGNPWIQSDSRIEFSAASLCANAPHRAGQGGELRAGRRMTRNLAMRTSLAVVLAAGEGKRMKLAPAEGAARDRPAADDRACAEGAAGGRRSTASPW